MSSFLQDLRHAARIFRRSPGFSAIAVTTLALGIGANTAIFSIVDAVLLRPLPYPGADRLVFLRETQPEVPDAAVSAADFDDWRSQTRSFTGIAATEYNAFTLTRRGAPDRVFGVRATANLFPLLGMAPERGRTFASASEVPGADNEIVASHAFWSSKLGRPALGTTLRLDGRAYALVGVMPPAFDYPFEPAIWVPLALTPEQRANRASHYMQAVGRLKDGATWEGAQAEMDALESRLAREHPTTNVGHGVRLVTLREEFFGNLKRTLYVLLGAVAFVLLLACANLANLLLARNAGRTREMAIRAAIGAGRGRIVRQLLTESLLLAAAGAAAGIAIATFGIPLLLAWKPWTLTSTTLARMDGRVLTFTLLGSLVTALLFGLAPALAFARTNLFSAMQSNGRSSAGPESSRARAVLVVSEIAIALTLLIAAGLMLRSAARLAVLDPGYDASRVLTLRVDLPEARYPNDAAARRFVRDSVEKLAALPGVSTAAAANSIPLGDSNTNGDFDIEGRPAWPAGQAPTAEYVIVTPSYFTALGIAIRQGRAFRDEDREDATPVAMVNETMARRFWPAATPIGKRIRIEWGTDHAWREIVGIVADVRGKRLDLPPPQEIYFPFAQHPVSRLALVVASALPPETLVKPAQTSLWSIDGDLPVPSLVPMKTTIHRSFARRRFSTMLLTLFASAALLLASLGVYGVLSQLVSERRREFGIRMTLGAQRGDVFRLVARRGILLTSLGITFGIAGALLVTRSLAALLFEVSPTDPLTFGALIAIMGAVSFLATAIPARRATRVDPIVALRAD
ncbi:MAG: ABC transporter permease [Acidobacteriota bacterium]|nr:ABC transporter permease [Acidobacteriota bacterium]